VLSDWNRRYGLALIRLGAAALSATSTARATEPVEPIRVELDTRSGCGNDEDILHAVLARTTRARAANPGETARSLRIAITADAQGELVGELSIHDPAAAEQSSEKRSIQSDSCRELLDALALFGALAVDPQASTEPLPAKAESPPPPPEPVAMRASGTPRDTSPPPSGRRTVGASVGLDAGSFVAGTAAPMLLAEPYLAASWSAPHDTGVALSPLARLSFTSVGGDTRDTADGPAHLHWTALRLGACPIELGILRSLGVRPCLELSAGALTATGKTIAHPESHTLSWVSLGPTARLEWRPHALVEVTASLGADVPLKRDHFYFEPNTFAYRPPALLGRGLLGVGLHFL
jgi:hypothetical protein